MYELTCLGLAAFVDIAPKGGWALLPNGIGFGNNIPNHYARFYLENERIVDASKWWAPVEDPAMTQRRVTVFQIMEPSDLTFTGMEEQVRHGVVETTSPEEAAARLKSDRKDALRQGDNDASRHTPYMPSLNELDRSFKVDPDHADVIARFAIRHATLYAYRLAESAVTKITVRCDAAPVTITARTRAGEMKTLVVADGTEIILSNMAPLGAHLPEPGEPTHINIYRRLDPSSRRTLREPKTIDSRLTPLFGPSRHPFVLYLRTRFGDTPRPGCSGLVYSSHGKGCLTFGL